MIAGIQASNANFLADLSNTENNISQVVRQISSGLRVNVASDDPSAVSSILAYKGQLAHLAQVQTNLNGVQTEAQTADGALQTAATLIDQLTTAAAQGASSTTDGPTRILLGQKVQQLEQELVAVANTSINGRFIFGGDDSSTPPYTFDLTKPEGVVQNTPQANTAITRDGDGNAIVPRLTAQQIFDARDPATGLPTAGNVFQAAFDLGTALLANNQTNIQTAIDEVKAGATQVGQSSTSYGNVESWLQQAQQTATSNIASFTAQLSTLRDTDIAADATALTLNQTALQAAIAAHGTLNTKSLFSYLG